MSDEAGASQGSREERKLTVVYAGSFNPVHAGHLAVLKALAARHCEVSGLGLGLGLIRVRVKVRVKVRVGFRVTVRVRVRLRVK